MGTKAAEHYDTSMLDDDDIVNLLLQRSSAVQQKKGIRDWIDGDDRSLRKEASIHKEAIFKSVFEEIHEVYDNVRPYLKKINPKRIADIGAGYAFIDLLFYQDFQSDIVLIDIEHSDDRHFGYQDAGAGYSSLKKAKEFLTANGVPAEKITTINPKHTPLSEAGSVDLAASFISCGFHYPVDTYNDFFNTQVRNGGHILLDIRAGSGGVHQLKKYGNLNIISRAKKLVTVIVDKPE